MHSRARPSTCTYLYNFTRRLALTNMRPGIPRNSEVSGLNIWANDMHVVAVQTCYRVCLPGKRPQLLEGPRFGGTNQQALFKRVSLLQPPLPDCLPLYISLGYQLIKI